MTIEEVSPSMYQEVIREPFHAFASAPFNVLNQAKAEKIYYLLFKDSKYRVGLIAGQIQGVILSPFSAPFCGFVPVHDDIKIETIEDAVELTVSWVKEKGFTKIEFTLPPLIYHKSFLAKLANVLHRKSFDIEKHELNFHLDLAKLNQDYSSFLWKNARKNLTIALGGDLTFTLCTTPHEQEKAYKIIQQNRAHLGATLRMSLEQMFATISVIPADFFIATTADTHVAAAIVFNIAPQIAHVVYWGDIPDFQHLKTMNFLSFKVFEFYKNKGFAIVDIGCATVDSEPNYGLLEFKESLGCDIQPKITYAKSIQL
jgi:hypothetical protein